MEPPPPVEPLKGPPCELAIELWITVFSYLPHSDLQQVRLVCRRWLALASMPKFKNKSKLKITGVTVRAIEAHLERALSDGDDCSLNYQSLDVSSIEEGDEKHLEKVLGRLGKNVRNLTLGTACVFSKLHILLPSLETLTLQWVRVTTDSRQLESLELRGFEQLKTLNLTCCGMSRAVQTTLVHQLVESNPFKLQQLHLFTGAYQEAMVLNSLERHVETLKFVSLSFFAEPLWDNFNWQLLCQRFQHLHTIQLTGYCLPDWLQILFESLPSALPMKRVDLGGILPLNDDVLSNIVDKWPQTLEAVELMFCVGLSDNGIIKVGRLRDRLRILDLSYIPHITNRGLLEGIASQHNSILRELHLNDVQSLDEQCVCLLAERLPYLEALSFSNCRKAVTNEALARIFCHQTRLQSLTLDDCICVSDMGILGYGDIPYSIRRLRGLQQLSMRGCPRITDESLMHAFHFLELRSLQLGYSHMITVEGIKQLVANAPAIETLTLSSCLMLNDDCISHIAKGLRRLKKLNISNCVNITHRSVSHIADHCNVLQILEMCGIDSLEQAEVEERLVHLRRHRLRTLRL